MITLAEFTSRGEQLTGHALYSFRKWLEGANYNFNSPRVMQRMEDEIKTLESLNKNQT